MLLYVAILGVSLILISLFLTVLLSSRVKNETINEVEQQGVQVISLLNRKIRSAEFISLPNKGENSNILIINNEEILFFEEEGFFYIEENGEIINLTNHRVVVENLVFENLGGNDAPDSIRISFLLSYNNQVGRAEYFYEKLFKTTVSLRNFNN